MTFVKNKLILIGFSSAAVIGIGVLLYTKIYSPKVTQLTIEQKKETSFERINGVGTLEAKEIIVLAPKSASTIAHLYADEGDRVQKGAVLARMELSELAGNKMESRALIAKSHSQMAVQKALIDDLRAKKELADVTLKRYLSLSQGGFVTQAELDTVKSAAQSAHALLRSAEAGLKQSEYEIERTRGSLSALDAKIDDLTLRSPINGIVIAREAEEGSTIGAGTSVFRIANPDTVWVKVYINEHQSGKLKVGQSATVILRAFPDKKFLGHIRRIGVESDRITEERVVYIGLNTLPEPLHLGEQAEAEIVISSNSSVSKHP